MILEALRSTLIVGTVLVNAVQLGHSIEPATVTNLSEPAPTAPLSREVSPTPTTSLMTPPPPVATRTPGLLTMKRVEASFAKLKHVPSGLATWYGLVLDNHHTASGERFDCRKLTAASNTLPFGTKVKVTNLKNGLSVIVRINDRGILNPGHVIDVSSAAAEKIGLLRMGIAPVHLDVLAKAS
jgi:rare lipoprotein A (peptidoglycan hydrolase)